MKGRSYKRKSRLSLTFYLASILFDCLIFEMFFIQELKPTLNKQCDSIRAKLFV